MFVIGSVFPANVMAISVLVFMETIYSVPRFNDLVATSDIMIWRTPSTQSSTNIREWACSTSPMP